jgi:hypothetical protein
MSNARIAGVFYLLTFASIPTLGLYAAVLEPGYVLGDGPDTAAVVGALLEIVVALACIGTAVALYPILTKHSQWMSLGFIGSRTLEAATIFAGAASLLAVVSLRQAGVGPDAVVPAQALVALHDGLRLGQSLMPAVNAALLATLLYRARLVPRILPLVGLIGAPLLVVTTLGALFGLWPEVSPITGVGALPIALWELSLGVWLVAKGTTTPREA